MRILVNGYFTGGNCPPFVKALMNLNHEVYLVDTGILERNDIHISPYLTREQIIIPGFTIPEMLVIKLLRKFRIFLWIFLIIPKYVKIIGLLKPDIIINHKINIRANIMLRTGFFPQVSYVYGTEVRGKMLKSKQVREVIRKSSFILTNTDEMRNYLLVSYPDYSSKIKYLPWGYMEKDTLFRIYNTDRLTLRNKYGFDPSDIIFFDSRSMREMNGGIRILLPSFRKFLINHPNSKLILIYGYLGTPVVKKFVQNFIDKNKELADKILIKEKINENANYIELLHISDIFISLLTHDQFGWSIYEAALMQKKMILYDIPVYHKYLYNLPQYIQDHSPDNLITAMEKAINTHISSDKQHFKWISEVFDYQTCFNNIQSFLQSQILKHLK